MVQDCTPAGKPECARHHTRERTNLSIAPMLLHTFAIRLSV